MKQLLEIVLITFVILAFAFGRDKANASNRPASDGHTQLDKNKA